MSSNHSDIWTGIGAILSSILSAYAWLNSIGLVPLFTFIAGACFTLWTQERLEKKRRKREFDKKMTQHIYGPIHQKLTAVLEALEAFRPPTDPSTPIFSFYDIMSDYRYGLVKKENRDQLEEFQKRLPPYTALLKEARREVESLTGRCLAEHGISENIRFYIWAGGETVEWVDPIDTILKDKTPLQFLSEEARPYKNFSMIVYVGNASEGHFSEEHRIHPISLKILEEARKDPTVQEQRREREVLLKQCNSLIESTEKKIVLS
jgi:hypothetical protein